MPQQTCSGHSKSLVLGATDDQKCVSASVLSILHWHGTSPKAIGSSDMLAILLKIYLLLKRSCLGKSPAMGKGDAMAWEANAWCSVRPTTNLYRVNIVWPNKQASHSISFYSSTSFDISPVDRYCNRQVQIHVAPKKSPDALRQDSAAGN